MGVDGGGFRWDYTGSSGRGSSRYWVAWDVRNRRDAPAAEHASGHAGAGADRVQRRRANIRCNMRRRMWIPAEEHGCVEAPGKSEGSGRGRSGNVAVGGAPRIGPLSSVSPARRNAVRALPARITAVEVTGRGSPLQ